MEKVFKGYVRVMDGAWEFGPLHNYWMVPEEPFKYYIRCGEWGTVNRNFCQNNERDVLTDPNDVSGNVIMICTTVQIILYFDRMSSM